jgi:hypothetical protein
VIHGQLTTLLALPPNEGGYQNDPVLGVVKNLGIEGHLLSALEVYVGILAATILFIATNAGIIGASRITYSMASYRQLPEVFRRLHPRFKTPWLSLIVFAGIISIAVRPADTAIFPITILPDGSYRATLDGSQVTDAELALMVQRGTFFEPNIGLVTLDALSSGGKITFLNSPSTFKALSANANNGASVHKTALGYGEANDPNLHAVKESSADLRRVMAIRALPGARVQILVGVDDAIVEAIDAGAVGWIAGLVNAFPAESVALYRHAMEGRKAEAFALYQWFLPLLRMDTVVKFVQLIKLAQQRVGMGSDRVRPPRMPLQGEELREATSVIDRALAARPALKAAVANHAPDKAAIA